MSSSNDLSMYTVAILPLKRVLNNLAHILTKGEEYADTKKIEHAVLLNARLFPDMYPMIRQVQIATDMSKGAFANQQKSFHHPHTLALLSLPV